MSEIQVLESLGCYTVAGYLDHYDGKNHNRIGSITSGGDLVYTDAGRVYAENLAMAAASDAMTAPASLDPMADLGVLMSMTLDGKPVARVDLP